MEENLIQNSQEQAPTTPPIKPKKAFKKWLLIGIVLILILSLPLGGYLVLNKMGVKPKPSVVTVITPTPQPTLAIESKTPTPTCRPRPACLDATPRCEIAETSDMCPKSTSSLDIKEFGVKIVLSDTVKDAYYIGTTANKGFVYLKVHSLDFEPQCKSDDSSTAALSRVGKDDINPMSEKKYSESFSGTTIGNYFYYIDLAQYACAQSAQGKAILDKVRAEFPKVQIIQ